MKKRAYALLLLVASAAFAYTQDKMYLCKSDKTTLGAPASLIDSLKFSNDGTTLHVNMGASTYEYAVNEIDSIVFKNGSNTVSIHYEGNTASVENPLAFEGITVDVDGADVTVTSTSETKNINFSLSGSTTDGMFKIYSEKAFTLTLNNLDITNPNGPAINIQSKKAAQIVLSDGSSNTVADGTSYDPAVETEDQSAAFFSEGQMIFSGSGNLVIQGSGSDQHALCSDDYIEVNNGNITISSSTKDGIHSKDGFSMKNGTVTTSANGDGIDVSSGSINVSGGTIHINGAIDNTNGMCCDSTLTVSGGNISISLAGAQSKGLKSTQNLLLNGGVVSIDATGSVVLTAQDKGYEPSYCMGIKSDAGITVDGAIVTITHSGLGGKGISAGTYFTMNSGDLNITTTGGGAIYVNTTGTTDAYSACCISSSGALNLLGGTLSASSSGIGGKGISSDDALTIGAGSSSPSINVTTSGAAILSGSNSITEPKAIKSDGNITIANGTVAVNAAGYGEGIDTKANIYLTGGTVVVQGPPNGSNTKCIDYETTFNITGGTLMACGPYRSKIPTPSTSSTQNFVYATLSSTSATLPASTLFNIQDAGANSLVTFEPARDSYFFLFSSPDLKKSTSYSIYTGGSTTGTDTNGLHIGGTYTPGTKKGTFTSSTTCKTTTSFSK